MGGEDRVECGRCKGFGRQRTFRGTDGGECPNCNGRGWMLTPAAVRAKFLRRGFDPIARRAALQRLARIVP